MCEYFKSFQIHLNSFSYKMGIYLVDVFGSPLLNRAYALRQNISHRRRWKYASRLGLLYLFQYYVMYSNNALYCVCVCVCIRRIFLLYHWTYIIIIIIIVTCNTIIMISIRGDDVLSFRVGVAGRTVCGACLSRQNAYTYYHTTPVERSSSNKSIYLI